MVVVHYGCMAAAPAGPCHIEAGFQGNRLYINPEPHVIASRISTSLLIVACKNLIHSPKPQGIKRAMYVSAYTACDIPQQSPVAAPFLPYIASANTTGAIARNEYGAELFISEGR